MPDASKPKTAIMTLAEAQLDEKNGQWMDAIGKRGSAIADMMGRPELTPTPRPIDPEDVLEALGEIYQPSKRNHDYLHRYWKHLRDYRHSARKVVEIGVQTPRSINMWEEFFPNAIIYGIDIEPSCANYAGGRKEVHIGDQMSEPFLMDFIQKTGGDFDVVIDDGIHTPYSMLRSFSYLYPALQSRGIYVIEDIQRSPQVMSFLYGLADCVNYYPADVPIQDWLGLSTFPPGTPWLISNTIGVSIHRYIAFIERGFNPRDNRYLLTPIELAALRAEREETVVRTAVEMKRKGQDITRDSLVAALGLDYAIYIDPYLSKISRTSL